MIIIQMSNKTACFCVIGVQTLWSLTRYSSGSFRDVAEKRRRIVQDIIICPIAIA